MQDKAILEELKLHKTDEDREIDAIEQQWLQDLQQESSSEDDEEILQD